MASHMTTNMSKSAMSENICFHSIKRLWNNDLKGFATAAYRIAWNSPIERCQFAPFVNGQSQQVHIGDLSVCDDRIGFEELKDTDVLRPELMPRSFTKLTKDVKYSRHIPRSIWIVRMAGNADKSIFGEGAGCPRRLTLFRKPTMD